VEEPQPVEEPQSVEAPQSMDEPQSAEEPQSVEAPQAKDEPQSAEEPQSVEAPQSMEEPQSAEEPHPEAKPVEEDQASSTIPPVLMSSDCPPVEQPSLLFSHIIKTGGSAMHFLLQKTIGSARGLRTIKDYKIDDPLTAHSASLTADDRNNYFVLGMVRRPCDHLLSWYVQKLNDAKKNHSDAEAMKEPFRRFVNERAVREKHGPAEPVVMSRAIDERYGSWDNVHCMMRTHNLKGDFMTCVKQFQACGGTLVDDGANLESLVDEALKEAADDVRAKGRSVGDHPACTEMFDDDMIATVMKTQQVVVDKYSLETCCSADPKA